MSQPTHEQSAVVESRARLLAVNAFAGTGKTSTLIEYARARPGRRILYLAFNRAVANEANDRFPKHVSCRTTHSLAYEVKGRLFAAKLGDARPFEVAQLCRCNPRRARLILDTLSAWLCSTDTSIGRQHVDHEALGEDDDPAEIVDQTRVVWEEMQLKDSPIKMPHDGYLKLWALERPRLRYDVILLDEAQDTNPLTLEVVMAQRHATIVLVGDRHQGIYGFRKAMNAMEQVKAEQRIALTQSFRFGQGIASVATLLLQHFKDETEPVRGREDIDVAWAVDASKHYAVLGRTNAGLFGVAANLVGRGQSTRLHFVGGFDGYLFGKVLDAYHLWADERSQIKEPSIARFKSFADFKKYGDEARDAETCALVKVVDQYRTEIPRIYAAIKAADTPLQERAHVTMTTAHKAKGLEWQQVQLCDDFVELPPDDETFDPEEINLLYVGVTRAISAIGLPVSLAEWLETVGFTEHLDDAAGQVDEAAEEEAGITLAHSAAAVGDGMFHSDDEREHWLRTTDLSRFGDARQEIVFLLARLAEVRAGC